MTVFYLYDNYCSNNNSCMCNQYYSVPQYNLRTKNVSYFNSHWAVSAIHRQIAVHLHSRILFCIDEEQFATDDKYPAIAVARIVVHLHGRILIVLTCMHTTPIKRYIIRLLESVSISDCHYVDIHTQSQESYHLFQIAEHLHKSQFGHS